jgi:TfoX/Sxy family transcriptional regulator of competence genes
MGATLEDLRGLLRDMTHGLADVTEKRAFGSYGFFVRETIFALAYAKELRIAVKLPDEVSHGSLMAFEGASPWKPHPGARKSPMSRWVLVPEAWHDDPRRLREWVRRAYEQVLRAVETEAEEAAITILHRGSTNARALEKRSKKTAAASSPPRKHSGSGTTKRKAAAKKKAAAKAPAKSAPARKKTPARKTGG